MPYPEKLNLYYLEKQPNGELLIREERMGVLYVILYPLAALGLVALTLVIQSEFRYLLGFIALVALAVSFVVIRSFMRPSELILSKQKRELRLRSRKGYRIIGADEIKVVKYAHGEVETTQSGLGPKISIQNIEAELTNGKQVVLLGLMTSKKNLSRNFDELREGEELMRIMRDMLGVKLRFMEGR